MQVNFSLCLLFHSFCWPRLISSYDFEGFPSWVTQRLTQPLPLWHRRWRKWVPLKNLHQSPLSQDTSTHVQDQHYRNKLIVQMLNQYLSKLNWILFIPSNYMFWLISVHCQVYNWSSRHVEDEMYIIYIINEIFETLIGNYKIR